MIRFEYQQDGETPRSLRHGRETVNVFESTSHRYDDNNVFYYCNWCRNACQEGEAICENCQDYLAEEERQRMERG